MRDEAGVEWSGSTEESSAWEGVSEEGPEYGMEARREAMRKRTREFAIRVVRLFGAMPHSTESQIIGKQLLRSATSVGAHYRESIRARSAAEFISKIEVALMELEETAYWLEIIAEIPLLPPERLAPLREEANQLLAIFTTVVRKTKKTS